MFVVALAELATPVDAEAPLLAKDLGVTAYEARLRLLAGLPSVVLQTPDKERALAALGALRARGHGAIACAAAAVVASEAMISMKRFELDPGGVRAPDHDGALLPWDDVLALVRASHRTRTDTTVETKEKKLRPGMAIATGGLVLSKTVTKKVTTSTEAREQVLYVFRRSGQTPFLLHEAGTRYAALGADVSPTSLENFNRTVALLRARAHTAAYDDRLMTRKVSDAARAGGSGTGETIDLLAHLVALWIARREREGAGPYRG